MLIHYQIRILEMHESKIIYIHIGQHKTGTTFLQRCLANNQRKLAENGVYLPHTGRLSQDFASHHNLAFEIKKDIRFEKSYGTQKDFFTELENTKSKKIIISSEDFGLCLSHNSMLLRFLNFRSTLIKMGFMIVWIVYLRNPVAYANSLYAEYVKNLFTSKTLVQWINSEGKKSHIFSICNDLHSLFSFGDKTLIRSYSAATRKGLLYDFMECIDLKISDLADNKSESRNDRLQSLQVEYFRMLACLTEKMNISFDRSTLVSKALEFAKFLPTTLPFNGITKEWAQIIRSETVEGYKNLAQKTGNRAIIEEFLIEDGNLVSNEFSKETANPEHIHALNQLFIDTIFSMTTKNSDLDRVGDIFKRLKKISQLSKMPEGVPADFTPLHYILMNPDVFRAGVDPIEHYLRHGAKEGRAYRTPQT